MKATGLLWPCLLLAGLAAWWAWGPGPRWYRAPVLDLRVQVVDYTVPFENYKEHRGLMWMLDHRRIAPPGWRSVHERPLERGWAGLRQRLDRWLDVESPRWDPSLDYVGYRPTDRDHPDRLHEVDLSGVDLVFIADTYGVYRDDLDNIPDELAHMDYNPMLFGGLDRADATALVAHADRGGAIVAEFNTLAEPTDEAVRPILEELLGVRWSGWAGRIFIDPYDDEDVPWWLPRQWEEQYPGVPLPTDPILAFAGPGGQIRVFPGPTVDDVTPRVMLTDAGAARFPEARGEAPYAYWFALHHAQPGAVVHARMELPPLPGLDAFIASLGVAAEPLMLVEPAPATGAGGPERGPRWYWAGEFGDLDFDPGPPDSVGIIERYAFGATFSAQTAEPVFWRLYAPVMHRLLGEWGGVVDPVEAS